MGDHVMSEPPSSRVYAQSNPPPSVFCRSSHRWILVAMMSYPVGDLVTMTVIQKSRFIHSWCLCAALFSDWVLIILVTCTFSWIQTKTCRTLKPKCFFIYSILKRWMIVHVCMFFIWIIVAAGKIVYNFFWIELDLKS